MFNPILGELVARERFKDYVREAEQDQLTKIASAPQPAQRADSRIPIGSFAISRLFKTLICTGQGWINLLFRHNDIPC
jgi:hypothetical protein